MKSASKECAPLNIRVNTVNPAPVETDMMRIIEDGMDSLSEEGNPKARIEESIPLGRYAQPEGDDELKAAKEEEITAGQEHFPFKPESYSDSLGLKACIFDNTGDGDFYKTSVAYKDYFDR